MLALEDIQPGMALVLSKWIALEGTVALMEEFYVKLAERLPAEWLRQAGKLSGYLDIAREREIAEAFGSVAVVPVGKSGIFGALWKLAEAGGVGLEVELSAIPIRQETVEICEVFGINPYLYASGGCLLMACEDGYGLWRRLKCEGIPAAMIGAVSEGEDRIVFDGERKRYLTPIRIEDRTVLST